MADWRPFTYHLHDDYSTTERVDFIARQVGLSPDDPIWEQLGRPFYEVALRCEIDVETAQVRITGVG